MTHFGPIFPILGAKKIFLENPALSHITWNGILAPCQNLEKINHTIPRKHLDRGKNGQTDRWKDRLKDEQTLFHRTVPATAGVAIKIVGFYSVQPSRK